MEDISNFSFSIMFNWWTELDSIYILYNQYFYRHLIFAIFALLCFNARILSITNTLQQGCIAIFRTPNWSRIQYFTDWTIDLYVNLVLSSVVFSMINHNIEGHAFSENTGWHPSILEHFEILASPTHPLHMWTKYEQISLCHIFTKLIFFWYFSSLFH